MNVIEIDKSCGELYKDGVYIYTTSPDFLQRGDCDHSWQSHDGTVLGYGSSLVHRYCESGIRCIVRCLNPSNLTQYDFNVFNSTTEAPGLTLANVNGNNTTSIAVSVVVVLLIGVLIVLIILIFLFYKKPRWRARVRDWCQRSERGHGQREDEENRVNPVRANGCVTGEEAQALKDNVTTVDDCGGSESE